jgi:two-component system chemotaxis response regulator CheY
MGRAAIPSQQSQPEPAAKLDVAVEPPPGRRLCLIVDDSRVVRKISRRIVESLGYTVVEAENGDEALARCHDDLPNLILLDWNMPVMTGLEFITKLREIGCRFRPKAVFCTSKNDAQDIAQGINAGADEYIIKPFDEATLRAKLEKIGAA